MTIPFHCPRCNAFTEVDDQYAGQTGPCATCGKRITVPTLSAAKANETRQQKRPLPIPLLITLAVGAALTLVLFLFGGLLAAFFVPTLIPNASGPADVCSNNMRQIAAAMLAYQEDQGTLPPAVVVDDTGKPLHSWRVLLLPYLGKDSLYKEFRLDEPWNSEHNRKLVVRMPAVFSCPSSSGLEFGETSYMVIEGEGMLFDHDKRSSTDKILDRPQNTILLVEVLDAQVTWTSPQDIVAERISWNINRDTKGIGSLHKTGTNVATADGKIYRYTRLLPAEQLRALATSDGGEPVDPSGWAE